MIHDCLFGHDITVLCVDVEKVGLVDALRAVTHTLARHDASKTLLHAIKDRSPDAAASGAANHDASVHTNCTKVACQIGSKEGRGIPDLVSSMA